ncbi:SDR family NAD(P)-dependent oxidoreductase [Pedobacter sp. NJ-S-72]
MKTSGNTVFISGGSAGIGLAIAKKLHHAGNKIIINGRNQERLKNALAELDHTVGIQGDLSIETDRIRISKELIAQHPDVNIIINNAGAAYMNDLKDSNNDAAKKAAEEMNTNYLGIIHFTSLLQSHLSKKEQAAIVNVSSIAVYRGNKYLPTYLQVKLHYTAIHKVYGIHLLRMRILISMNFIHPWLIQIFRQKLEVPMEFRHQKLPMNF